MDWPPAFFVLDKWSPFEMRARLTPALRTAGVPFADEVVDKVETEVLAAAGGSQDLVSQLESLARLQESRFLSAEEVAAAKAKLLEPPV